ncbi:MAG: nuclear transport factor 2 family protein [Marmoricola sp.]|nr:nuclear transport factor 2 family protein [Marmoricola sp.]
MASAVSAVDSPLLRAADVHRLLDEDAVRRVHLEYCRGIDRRDWELVRSCYHTDAIDHHGPFTGGVDAFILWGIEVLADVQSMHFTGNQLVEVDGDVAWHEAYCIAFHRISGAPSEPKTDWVVNVRYLDRFERRDGAWKIADRLVVHDSDRRDLVPGTGEIGPGWTGSGPWPDDPSYNRSENWASYLAARIPGS